MSGQLRTQFPNATDDEWQKIERLYELLNMRDAVAFTRGNALSEIEVLADFNLTAYEMRKEIRRITSECSALIARGYVKPKEDSHE